MELRNENLVDVKPSMDVEVQAQTLPKTVGILLQPLSNMLGGN